MAPGIYGFDHIAVRLEDFDAGIAAYKKLFPYVGPRFLGDNPNGENTAMGLRAAAFDLANGGFIEIVAPTGPKSALMPDLEKKGPGMALIAFQVEDLAATVAQMKSNGVQVFEADPTHVMVHPKSTHGVLMQIVEKPANAPVADKAGNVPDTSGNKGSIVSYKCCVVFVSDVDKGVASYEKLGLKRSFRIKNKKNGIIQAGFMLRGGGLIELIGPLNPEDPNDNFAKFMKRRGEGFQHLSLDATEGAADVLAAAGIQVKVTDPQHADIHKGATLTKSMLLQLNPVGMGTKREVKLGAGSKL